VEADAHLTREVAAAAPYTAFLGLEIVAASADVCRPSRSLRFARSAI
jgi:hypothetical protein